jgi:hypothetical protein
MSTIDEQREVSAAPSPLVLTLPNQAEAMVLSEFGHSDFGTRTLTN